MIYYIGYYDVMVDGKFSRAVSPAAVRKMDYIINKLAQIQQDVTVVSPASKQTKVKSADAVSAPGGAHIRYYPVPYTSNRYLRAIFVRLAPIWLFFFCLFFVKRQDTVVYYHAPDLDRAVMRTKKLKKFTLVSEIEEIYSLIWDRTKREIKSENLFLETCTEKAIVVSESLKSYLQLPKALVSYGSYDICSKERLNPSADCIQLVYSGGIEHVRGSAFTALEVMDQLPKNYKLTLSGPCAPGALADLEKKIAQLNAVRGEDNVKYVGLLPTEDFEALLLSANIALNLQVEGNFSSFLFPSKILTYLSHNLPVVTTPGNSITSSCLSDILYISDDYSIEKIIQTIQRVNLTHEDDYRCRLKEMDEAFAADLKALIIQ